jgi:hypothetical protein
MVRDFRIKILLPNNAENPLEEIPSLKMAEAMMTEHGVKMSGAL